MYGTGQRERVVITEQKGEDMTKSKENNQQIKLMMEELEKINAWTAVQCKQ